MLLINVLNIIVEDVRVTIYYQSSSVLYIQNINNTSKMHFGRCSGMYPLSDSVGIHEAISLQSNETRYHHLKFTLKIHFIHANNSTCMHGSFKNSSQKIIFHFTFHFHDYEIIGLIFPK